MQTLSMTLRRYNGNEYINVNSTATALPNLIRLILELNIGCLLNRAAVKEYHKTPISLQMLISSDTNKCVDRITYADTLAPWMYNLRSRLTITWRRDNRNNGNSTHVRDIFCPVE